MISKPRYQYENRQRTWLPWHVDPCCGTRWVESVSDGCTTLYLCPECDDWIADLIAGAEP